MEPGPLERLRADLRRAEEVFPELLAPARIEKDDVAAYYDRSFAGYTLFHSREGAVHLALTPDGGTGARDFRVQADEVAHSLRALAATSVIEVGCGRGFNLAHLARIFPECRFHGIDYSPAHVRAARKRLRRVANADVEAGDFHDLTQLEAGRADLVFAVETLCHATSLSTVLAQMHRVLRPGGLVVIYDAVRNGFDALPPEMARAVRYTETAMAVPAFPELGAVHADARGAGFEIVEDTDRSADALPDARRLEALARRFFARPYLPGTRIPVAPRSLTMNAVAGLFMPLTLETRALGYRRFVLRKA